MMHSERRHGGPIYGRVEVYGDDEMLFFIARRFRIGRGIAWQPFGRMDHFPPSYVERVMGVVTKDEMGEPDTRFLEFEN